MEAETLPVVVKKNKAALQGLAKPGCQQRQLCPHGKLLSFVDARGIINVHDLCNPLIHCTINSHQYSG